MLLLKNVSLFNGRDEAIQKGVSIAVNDDGTIAAIHSSEDERPTGDFERVIDGNGRTALPGMINAHAHLCLDPDADFSEFESEPPEMTLIKMVKNARATIEGGITTVRDLGCRDHLDFALKKAVEEGIVPGPRILCSGKVITKTGGHGHFLGREADGEAEIVKAVREQVKAGADIIKVMSTGGVMTEGVEPGLALYSLEEMKAAAEEAKRCRKPTASHAQGAEGIKNAVLAGIDTIEHGIYMTDEVADLMIDRGTYWVPTLAPGERLFDPEAREKIPDYAKAKADRVFPIHRESFANYSRRDGMKLGIGTDSGVPGVYHSDIVVELEAFKRFGFTNFEVLKLAAFGNAEMLGKEDEFGSIEVGKSADILLVDGNPLEDLAVLRAPKLVMKEGKVLHQEA